MSKERITEAVIGSLAKHPYLWALALCLFAEPIIDGSRLQYRGVWLFCAGVTVLLFLYYYADMSRYRDQVNSAFIIAMGFVLKLSYVVNTSIYVRQHDVGYFGGDSGHCGYIEYLLVNHKLPDFDVRERWQFCHPPLHHAISAVWIYINEHLLLTSHDAARESLQTLTLFYSVCIIISSYKILRRFGLEGRALFIPLMIVSFHPAFILLSGSINNDALSAAFIMGAVSSALSWYKERSVKNIVKIALCIGLGMMTKISAAVAAFPTGLLFLIAFIKNIKTEAKKLILQFMLFAAICCPTGLWFGVRNFVKWDIPLTYVQKMEKTELQYIGDRSFMSRITDFSSEQIDSIYLNWAWKDDSGEIQGYNEYNPLISALKTSVFGEFLNEKSFDETRYLELAANILFWTGVLLAVLAFVSAIMISFMKYNALRTERLFLISFYLAMILSFYKMAHDYPFTCAMNFRYITPTVTVGAVFMGMAIKRLDPGEKPLNIIGGALQWIAVVFSLSSGVVFLSLL